MYWYNGEDGDAHHIIIEGVKEHLLGLFSEELQMIPITFKWKLIKYL